MRPLTTLANLQAKKLLADLSPAHTTASRALRQLRELRRQIQTLVPQDCGRELLQLPHKPTFSQADLALVGAWKRYLKWEEKNPLALEDEQAFAARMQGVYREAIARMRFFPEIWWAAQCSPFVLALTERVAGSWHIPGPWTSGGGMKLPTC